jgi:hypothetical protein
MKLIAQKKAEREAEMAAYKQAQAQKVGIMAPFFTYAAMAA